MPAIGTVIEFAGFGEPSAMKSPKLIAASAALIITVGCAVDDPNRRTKTGAAIGAVAGAVIGHQTNSKNGRFAGAAIGALTGAAVGRYMDNQQKQFERQLAAERRNADISLTRIDEDTLRIDVSSNASFAVDSASIQADFRDSLARISSITSEYDKTIIHVIGHTDSTGSEAYNQQLSEKRANAVARFLNQNGVERQRLYMDGRGELQPVASNRSAAGRDRNRRVEIYLKAVVEGREKDAYRPPV